MGARYAKALRHGDPVELGLADIEQACRNLSDLGYSKACVLHVEDVVAMVGEDQRGDIEILASLGPEGLISLGSTAVA